MRCEMNHCCIIKIVLLLLLLTVIRPPAEVFAGGGVATWNPPTTNTDGTQLVDLAGYKLYWRTASGSYSQSQSMNISVCSACPDPVGTEVEIGCIGGLTPGTTYYIVATAYNTSGNESDYSNEVTKTIPLPANPTGNIYTGGASMTRVDGYDLNLVNHCYGTAILGSSCTLANKTVWASCEAADTSGDGKVDGVDVTDVTSNFGRTQ